MIHFRVRRTSYPLPIINYICTMANRAIRIIMAGTLLLLMTCCANMKAPGGGPKDIYPPEVIGSEPPNYSTNFRAHKITLKFNEFVTVSDVVAEVFISPPLEKTPDIKTRGKSVIITIDEKLHDSTTYSIFFGKSIKDLTEGNPIENYNYVFSTGDRIDSLSVIGEVINAFDLKPREDVLVMLYEDLNDTIPFDSLPYLVKPSYLTRTNAAGFFVINNLRQGEYMLFALADINLSTTYDQGEEEIAFLDSLVSSAYMVAEAIDSLATDSLATDSLASESLPAMIDVVDTISLDTMSTGPDRYTLFMFQEEDTTQRLLGADKPRERVLRFMFRRPAKGVAITPLTPVPDNWMVSEWNEGNDTLRYYLLSSKLDTLSLKISQDTTVFDTVSFSLAGEEELQEKKDRDKDLAMGIFTNIKTPFPYFEKPLLMTGYPFIRYDFSGFMLVEDNDTLQPKLEIFGQAGRMIRLDHELKENTQYLLFFPDSLLTDLAGHSNDSTEFRFKTDGPDSYGSYKLHITNTSPYPQLIIQLYGEDEKKMYRENVLEEDGTIVWKHLPPRKYVIKAIGDINRNGQWDTGNFLAKQQPEPVVYMGASIEVREGWSFEEDWIVSFR